MNDKNQKQRSLFEEEKDFDKPKPNPRKEYKRKPKNAHHLEEWIDDDVDIDILRFI